MNILIIPEDFRNDQYILKPIIEAMVTELGKPTAKVRVCKDSLLGGVSQALKWDNILQIIERYKGMVDLFLLCVDRDNDVGRKTVLTNIEQQAQNILPEKKGFLAENAWQEIEVWVLAGHSLPKNWNWQAIRNESNPKEVYFLPFAKECGVINEPGEGRKTLANEVVSRYKRIRRICPEDIANLEGRIKNWL
ncbi:MAG: hypothetical protein WCS37_08265 [Chloroflexota bacterium]|nr:hypothetical protein [Chloroflexota bacterium]